MLFMKTIQVESHEHAILLRLTNGPTNALSADLIAQLAEAVADVARQEKGLVLAGGEKFFSIGLDLPEVLEMERAAMGVYWRRFEEMLLDIFTLPVPTACAMTGHATAGGMILSLTTDLRLMAHGRKLMGLNEMQIGIMIPYFTHLMLEQRTSAAKARQLETSGEFLGPEDALAAGLVDEVLPAEEVEAKALALVSKTIRLPRKAFVGTKDGQVRITKERFLALRDEKEQSLLDSWFDPGTQTLLREAAKKF